MVQFAPAINEFPNMAKRQKNWARAARTLLRITLGNRCAKCGAEESKDSILEFDCILPQGHEHHRIDTSWRMSFYRQQHAANNLQLLCQKCHSEKTRNDKQDDNPF